MLLLSRGPSRPSSGVMQPVVWYVSQDQSWWMSFGATPKRRAAASSTRRRSGTASLPIPLPGIAAILCVLPPTMPSSRSRRVPGRERQRVVEL